MKRLGSVIVGRLHSTRLVTARGCLTQALERTALTVLAIAFFAVSLVFVWRSFYSMRIPEHLTDK